MTVADPDHIILDVVLEHASADSYCVLLCLDGTGAGWYRCGIRIAPFDV